MKIESIRLPKSQKKKKKGSDLPLTFATLKGRFNPSVYNKNIQPLAAHRRSFVLCIIQGNDMIVKSNEAQRRSFLGVDFVLLSHGPESMVTKMLYKQEDHPPLHKHANEQSGYVISGEYRIVIDNVVCKIGPGDSYTIPRDVEHRIEIMEPGEVLDFFSPPRKDYL